MLSATRAIMQSELVCPVTKCGLDFEDLAQLKSHYFMFHLKTARFRCDFCPKKLPTPQVLTRHIEEHLHAKPFPCTLLGCQSRFIREERNTAWECSLRCRCRKPTPCLPLPRLKTYWMRDCPYRTRTWRRLLSRCSSSLPLV